MLSRIARRLPWALAFTSLLAVGCAAPADSDTDDGTSAIRSGTRFTSPLELGSYDAEDGSLVYVDTTLDRQHIYVQSPTAAGPLRIYEGDLDKAAGTGRLTVDDRSSGAHLELSPKGDDIELTGAVSGLFLRRKNGALDGTYPSAEKPANKLVVRSSTAGSSPSIAFTWTRDGTTYEGNATAAYGIIYRATVRSCEVSFINYNDRAGFRFVVSPAKERDTSCTFLGGPERFSPRPRE